jgi:hypothetical protein
MKATGYTRITCTQFTVPNSKAKETILIYNFFSNYVFGTFERAEDPLVNIFHFFFNRKLRNDILYDLPEEYMLAVSFR